jgi:hypothetical protein
MANQNRQFPIEINGTAAMVTVASLLILLGIVLQLGQLGYGHFDARNYWLFSLFASGIWNMLALQLNAPSVGDVIQLWPLLLVGTGLAVLLVSRKNGLSREASVNLAGDRHGR